MENKNKKRKLGAMGILGILVFSTVLFAGKVQAGEISASEVIKLVNKSRSAAGLDALSENPTLEKAAKSKAEDMLKNDYFAHTSPSGKDPWYWIGRAGYDYKYAGENLAINYENAKEQHSAWMKSASHKKNILNGNYTQTGVAVAEGKIDGDKVIIAVQLFATPAVVAPLRKDAVEQMPVKAEKAAEVLPAETSLPELVVPEPEMKLADSKIGNVDIVPEAISLEQNFLQAGFFAAALLLIVAAVGIIFGINRKKEHEKIILPAASSSGEDAEAEKPILSKDKMLESMEEHLKSLNIVKRIRGRPG